MQLSLVLNVAILWTILAGLAECQQSQSTKNQKCGYEACNPGKPGMLNVHIVCHTHDDVGWVLTVQQYYQAYVREIIHSVIFHLNQDENRRFVYVESAFFHMWWEEQSLEMKNRVKDLVREGRLEFVGGGWVMNDEAVTHYTSIIDQMTLGMRFLNDTFGDCGHPKTVWQIDPFGHSREQASLFSQMGFDGEFLGRIDYQDIEVRRKRRTMEFLWRGNPSLGRDTELFTGVLPNVYWPPKGFCYDTNCWDEEITDQNALQKAYDFIHLVKEQAKQYKTNHTIITMGMDFYYRHAGKWYRNLEQLMAKINELQKNGSDVNIFFSTPACYLKSLNGQKVNWHTETDDFFPYASESNSYWTGYFTSRPTSKYYGRRASAFLQTCKQITAFGSMPTANIFSLQSAVGVMQHHDALTGTEKLHVAHDYAKSLSLGIGECQNEVKTALSRIMSNTSISLDLHFCNLLNQTECLISEKQSLFQLLVYNSLSREITSFVRLPVTGEAYEVLDHNSKLVPVQIIPLQRSISRIPERISESRFELVFPLTLPALGTTTYTVRRLQDLSPVQDKESVVVTPRSDIIDYLVIQNEYIKAKVNSVTGLLEKVEINGREINFKQSYYYYTSQPGFQNEKASGAYSFNPVFETPIPVTNKVNASLVKGDLVQEVRQEFSSWVSQVIRLYKGKPYIEFDWIVGPIPTKDYGKEVISKFETPLANNGTFYTDSNSRDSIKRIRNFRPTWNLTVMEPVAGNYYPVTGWIYLRDDVTSMQLTVFPDRAQGGSSIHDGSLELMVHRRTLYDDGYGVDEALNELGLDGQGLIARGKHWVVLSPVRESPKHIRELSKELYHEPDFIFRTTNESTFAPDEQLLHYSYMSRKLPANVHLLSLEMLNAVEILVRLEHMYATEEDSEYSKTVSVPLRNLFCPFSIETVRETTLSAHQYLNTIEKLRWNENQMFGDAPVDARNETNSTRVPRSSSDNSIEDELVSNSTSSVNSTEFLSDQSANVQQQQTKDEFEIVLEPMQIRTFIVTISRTLVC